MLESIASKQAVVSADPTAVAAAPSPLPAVLATCKWIMYLIYLMISASALSLFPAVDKIQAAYTGYHI